MTFRRVLGFIATLLLVGCSGESVDTEVAIGSLSQPRGVTIHESELCVAEAGAIGEDGPAREQPGQLEADTGRVLCAPIAGGEPVAVLEGLPFVYYPDAAVTSGVADVIRDDDTYALVGESYGDLSRSIVEIGGSGPRVVADLLAFAEERGPVDGEVRSNPWSFVFAENRDGFYVAEAAAGTILRVDLDGTIETHSTVPGHEVLTGITWGPDGELYVASFGQLPHPRGSGSVVAIDSEGIHRVVVPRLTMAIDVGFDASGGMLILEYAMPPEEPTGTDAYRDDSGRLLYVEGLASPSQPRVLLDDLARPTSLAVDGETVVISVTAGEQAREDGAVLKFRISDLLD